MNTKETIDSAVIQDSLPGTPVDVAPKNDFAAGGSLKDDLDAASFPSDQDEHKGGCCSVLLSFTEKIVPPGGHFANMFTMASGTLGIGIVSMASGFRTTGLGLAAILLVVCGLLIVFSFYLVGEMCQRSPYRSWESAARAVLFRGSDYFVAGVLIFFIIGTMIGYVIAVHDLMGGFLNHEAAPAFLLTGNGRRLLTATVWLFGMLCLSIPRNIASLRYFSVIGVVFVVYFVICVVVNSCRNGLPHLNEMEMFSTGMDGVNGFTLFIFAFLAHGLLFRLYTESSKPSAKKLAFDGGCSVTLVATLYYITGFFGYADIGPTITGSIFKYYNIYDNPMMFVAYLFLIVKVCIAYALCNQACRLPIFYCLRRDIDQSPFWVSLVITIVINVVALILGLFIPDINIVFNLLGSICGGILAFLFPSFYVMYLGGWTVKKVGWFRVGCTYLTIIAGVVSIVWGTASTIFNMVLTYG